MTVLTIQNNQGCCEGMEGWVVTVEFAGHNEKSRSSAEVKFGLRGLPPSPVILS